MPYLRILLFLFRLAALSNTSSQRACEYFIVFLSFLDLAWEASGFERLRPIGHFVYLMDAFFFLPRDLSGEIV